MKLSKILLSFCVLSAVAGDLFAIEKNEHVSKKPARVEAFSGTSMKNNKVAQSFAKAGLAGADSKKNSKVAKNFSVSKIASVSKVSNFSKIVKIKCVGNLRIDSETIESYVPIKAGDQYDENMVNESLKALNATEFFSSIKFKMAGDVLVISVKEYPLINKISFEGNSKIKDADILKTIKLKPKQVLSPAKAKEFQQGFLEFYRKRLGIYNASVKPKIIKLPNNTVNLVFEINEGKTSSISRIVFVGNKAFSSGELRGVVSSKTKRWYRWFVKDDFYDADRIIEDKQRILKFYHNHGYVNAHIVSAVAELSSDKRESILTFTIVEGEKYRLGNVKIVSQIDGLPEKDLSIKNIGQKGEVFDKSMLNKCDANLIKKACQKGFASASVSHNIHKNEEKKTIDVDFNVAKVEPLYVSKIVINGNTKTFEHIIRRELWLEEGDHYSEALLEVSENNLRKLGYFKSVRIDKIRDENADDKCIVIVTVEEQSTGAVMVSGGYSTSSGVLVNLDVTERNFFGKGKTIHVALGSGGEISKHENSNNIVNGEKIFHNDKKSRRKFKAFNNINVLIGDSHIFDHDMDGTLEFYRTETRKWDCFNVSNLGAEIGCQYDLSQNFSQSLAYGATNREIKNVVENSSPLIKHQVLKIDSNNQKTTPIESNISFLRHTISFKKHLTSFLRGRFDAGLTTIFAGLGGDAKHMKNTIFGTYVIPVLRDVNIVCKAAAGILTKVNDNDLSIIDSFALGGDSFRGFEYGGFGPFSRTKRQADGEEKKEFQDYLGATKYWKGSVDFVFPMGLPEELHLRGIVFSEFGSIWDAPEKGEKFMKDGRCNFDKTVCSHEILDSKKVRVTLGTGVSFITPFGPIQLLYSVPVRKEKYDNEKKFLLSFTTAF